MPGPEFSGNELVGASGGEWLDGRLPGRLNGVFTDTRTPSPGALFVALNGERFDAHDFLDRAMTAGAGALCIRRDAQGKLPENCTLPVLMVDDPLRAYQAIARLHRRRFPELKLAAVTGSVGKTSVKEMIRAIFTEEAGAERVLYTVGNTNNQIGVPQNLLRLNAGHRYAVIEMGTNRFGEIEPLSRMAEPAVALINSIAPCHLEFLGSLEGIAEEKSHIFDGLSDSGAAVIPAECPAVELLEKRTAAFRRFRFGVNAVPGGVTAHYLGGQLEGSRFELTFPGGERMEISWALTGRHQAINAAAAASVALACGISPAVIAAGLAGTVLPGMRSKLTRIDGITFVNDAYNANPGSMRASFDWLAEFADPLRLVLVLGEMRELGEVEQQEHAELLRQARCRFPGARIFTIGAAFPPAAGIRRFDAAGDAAGPLAKAVRPGDLVFAKGSRGIAVEQALPEAAR